MTDILMYRKGKYEILFIDTIFQLIQLLHFQNQSHFFFNDTSLNVKIYFNLIYTVYS